jgi:MoaA/NifB/PqqE/SkfB family radical SAM enzyme
MQTYEALAKLQESDPRLRIHSISTATDVNMDEIRKLTSFLYDRCPKMDHHNLAMIRGDRKNPSLHGPGLEQYRQLYEYVRRLWATREKDRYGSIVEPMLQWAKSRTAATQAQVVPCRAGILNAVVYANGDVSVCENHPPLGNLRQKSFPESGSPPKPMLCANPSPPKAAIAPTRSSFGPASRISQPSWYVPWLGPKSGRAQRPFAPTKK